MPSSGAALRLLRAVAPEPALLQDADRAHVVPHDVGVQRPDRHLVHEQGERPRRDAAAPPLASDPVAEQLLPVLRPAADVARHHAVGHDGAHHQGVVAADLRPVRLELILVASGERRHLDRLRIRLVLEEDVEIPVLDPPETHRGCHVVDSGHVPSLLASALASTPVSEDGTRDRLLPGTRRLDGPHCVTDRRHRGSRDVRSGRRVAS